MVEPPGDLRRTGIFEIYNGIFIAVELLFVEEGSGAMQQTAVHKFHIAADAFAVKAGEQRRRRGPVKTLIVIKDPYSHSFISFRRSTQAAFVGISKTLRVNGFGGSVKGSPLCGLIFEISEPMAITVCAAGS
jgi:hypothetical protein